MMAVLRGRGGGREREREREERGREGGREEDRNEGGGGCYKKGGRGEGWVIDSETD
jgi:hypothetical protein